MCCECDKDKIDDETGMFYVSERKDVGGITVKRGINCVEAKQTLHWRGQALMVQEVGGDLVTISTRR
jgi:hypothetical protein